MNKFSKKFIDKAQFYRVLFVVFITVFMPLMSVAAEKSYNDPQENLIKKVLSETGAEFGWNVGENCVYSTYHDNTFCTEISGPELMPGGTKDDWKVRYRLLFPRLLPPDNRVVYDYPVSISAWKTTQAANNNILEEISLWGPTSKKIFHNKLAISYGGDEIGEWQAGRFLLSVDIIPQNSGFSRMEINEALYANAIKYGLISEGNPAQDSDGDGIPDDVDQCPNTPAHTIVDSDGCPVFLQLSLNTDKSNYLPGETATISGNIADKNGPLSGASISIDINGKIANLVSRADGSYKLEFPLPANPTIFTYQVTATVSYSGYQDVTKQATFAIGQDMSVTITPDKDSYSIGDTVYCSIKVEDASGNPVPYTDLSIKTVRLVSNRTEKITGTTDALGENLWSFVWGKDAAGKTIAEGKLKIEISATKAGFNKASTELLISGCGDLIVDENEYCLDCPEDCPCGPQEVCDPSSDFKNSSNMCSPKSAYVFISQGVTPYQKMWILPLVYGIKNYYRKLGYKVVEISENHINKIATYLSRPSTGAIAWFGHGEEPGGKATIEATDATTGGYSIKDAIDSQSKEAGGFLYRCQYEIYATKWVDIHDKIEEFASQRKEHPNLDYLYNHSCYSLDDDSLINYLLKDGGIYWGHRGVLSAVTPLTKVTK